MKTSRIFSSLALSVIAPLAALADGPPLFEVRDSLSGTTRTGNKLADLLEDAIKGKGDFSSIGNNDAAISVTYAGIPNALAVSVTTPTISNPSAPYSATLTLGAFTKTFTGTSKDDVQKKLEDFFTKDNPERDEAVKQLKKVWAMTPVTITDGTPHSSTAMVANRAFDEFGLRLGKTRAERAKLDAGESILTSHLGVEASYGSFETKGGYTGTTFTAAPTLRFGDRYGLVISLPVRYLDIQGSQSGEAAAVVGLPLQLISENKDSHLFWQVTPHAFAAGAGSLDLFQAGLSVGGGLTNRVGYNFGSCTLTMANQLGSFQGLDIMGVDTGVKQLIMKNGVSLSVPVMSHWLAEVRAVRTDFLKDAPFDAYYTFGADLVFRSEGGTPWWLFMIPDDVYVGVAYDTDLKDYSAPYVRGGLKWTW